MSRSELFERLSSATRILLTGPESSDGDSIGACLALQHGLLKLLPGLQVDVAGRPGRRYSWLAGAEAMIPDFQVLPHYDAVIVLDGDRKRLHPVVAQAFDKAGWRGIIDHHRSTDVSLYELAVFEPEAESTCGMVYRLLQEWGPVPLDKALSEAIYTGLIFDTGCFRYANASRSAHELAAALVATGIDHATITRKVLFERSAVGTLLMGKVLAKLELLNHGKVVMAVCSKALMEEVGASDEDIEGIVDALQQVEAELAVLIVEKGPERVKLSLRSQGSVDVAALACSLEPDGGGHARAAGALLKKPLEEVIRLVRERVS
jgi:phosphoesterase RecJ-like protein